MSRRNAAAEGSRVSLRGSASHRVAWLGCLALTLGLAWPSRAQEGGETQSFETMLGMFGLSCGEVVFVVVGIAVVAWLGLYVGARLAGLAGGIGKALVTLLLQGLLWLPAGFVLAFLPMPSQGLPAVLASQGFNVLLGALVVRWQYSTDWKRAFFAEIVATVLAVAAVGVMIWLVF